jgi:hypothetical protein
MWPLMVKAALVVAHLALSRFAAPGRHRLT